MFDIVWSLTPSQAGMQAAKGSVVQLQKMQSKVSPLD